VLEDMLASRVGEDMLASARVLPYDYALLGDGLVPARLAARGAAPTLVLAAGSAPSTARALVAALPRAEFRPTRTSLHEMEAAETASLITSFLVAR